MPLVLDGDTGIVGVLLTDSNGNVTFDTNTLYVDAPNNRVGMGTTTPENALHIASSDNAQMLLQNTSTGDASIKFNRSGQTFFMGIESSDNSFRISDTATGVGDGDRLIIDTSGNPTFTGTAHTSLQVRSSDLSTVAFMQTVQGTDIRIGGSTDHPVDLYSNGTRRVRITSTGDVGIGTTNPSAALHVKAQTSQEPLTLGISSNGWGYITFQNATPSDVAYLGLGGGAAVTTGGYNDFAIRSNGNLLFGAGSNSERMRIASDGKVGIGTTSPLSGLHLSDGTNAGAPQNGGRQATLMIDAGATASADLQFMVRDGYNSHIFFGDAADPNVGMLWYQHNNNSMYFSTNASQRMTITGSGTVSIEPETGTTSSGVSGAAGGSLDLNGGTAFTGRLLFTGVNDSGTNLIGFNNESNGLVMYDYTEDQYIMKTNNDQKVSFGGGFPNVSGSSTRVYNVIVDDGICIGDGGYTHGYVGTNGTDGDVYIAANAYPANLGVDRNVIIATGSPGGGGPKEVVRYNQTDGARRDYSANTGSNRKWWSTTNTNFGEVYEYDYGNKLYFKKTRAVAGYAQMILINRYMPNQYDVSFELLSGDDANNNPYRHFGIALNHVGTENTSQFDYVVLRQRYGNSNLNQIRIDQPGGTIGTTEGSSIPNFHDETKRKVMIQKRASTLRIQVHELNSTVYTYGTITGINWTNSSGYFGFSIYESTNSKTWAEISNLTFTDVIA